MLTEITYSYTKAVPLSVLANQRRITRISTNWSALKDCENNVRISHIYIYSLVGLQELGHGREIKQEVS